ncbi:MAG: hypothetical protein KDC39_13210 [Actinobacteria bacterium]|nr:hypothetical protein [Actinomycetota bacterium]
MSSHFHCSKHGEVPPRHAATILDNRHVEQQLRDSQVPAWLPWPLPKGWVSAGMQLVGDAAGGIQAVATAVTGPALTYGPADLIIVAEKPGTGLGCWLAGLSAGGPDVSFTDRSSDAKVRFRDRFIPLWNIEAEDVTVYVGESAGCWLWLLAWPESAWSVIHDGLRLVDLRSIGPEVDIPAGAVSPRLL